ncbi:MAG: alcohol dehydrogenase [Puniceicoccaceae bacterium 5H]|nr:MAG: alcohol dehydrogenase [Puniceicoccaceae bacterium 5H]
MIQPELKLVDADHPRAQLIAILEDKEKIGLAHAEIPEPGPDEIRIKIKWVGICGSDVEAYRGARAPEFLAYPTRLGHEVAGTIEKVGENVLGLKVGDQVTCRYVWGAFAEYIVCQPFNVKVVPPNFPLIETSLIEVLPGVIHAAELSEIKPNSRVLITGQGVSGLVMTQVIQMYSPAVLAVTDLHERNLELARKYGATHTYRMPDEEAATMDVVGQDFPEGFDVVIPCLLEGDGMVDTLEAAAFGGRIVMYGCIGTCHQPFDFFKVHRKRLNIYSTEPRSDIDMRRFFQESVQMVVDSLVNTREMITHTLPLERIQEAFELRTDKQSDALHVLVDCERR